MVESFTSLSKDQGKLTPDDNYNMYEESIEINNANNVNLVNKALTEEKLRLEKKSRVIQPLYETALRKKSQLKSETMKTKAYNRMFLLFSFILILSLLLLILRNYFPIIPEFLIDILIIFIVAGGFIVLIMMYVDILKRDKMDFEKIDYDLLIEPKDIEDKNGISNSTKLSTDVCIGDVCCKTGDYFVNNQCSKCPEGMRYNSDGNCVEAFSINGMFIRPYFKMPSFSKVA